MKIKRRRESEDKPSKKVGGFAFLISIPALTLLVSGIYYVIIPRVFSINTDALAWLTGGCMLGLILAKPVSKGRLYVFLHEVKHAVVSSIAGNKWKKMKVGPETGSFEYTYYKHTAHLNAFISLAPYWFPIISIPIWILAPIKGDLVYFNLIVGFALGLDLYMGLKDMGPHQSDLSTIRGGVKIAKLYIILMNALVVALVLIGATQGFKGFSDTFLSLMVNLYKLGNLLGGLNKTVSFI